MPECTPSEAAMTCLNPHAHYLEVTSSPTWDWIVRTPKPRSLSRDAKKRYRWLRWHAIRRFPFHRGRQCRYGLVRT